MTTPRCARHGVDSSRNPRYTSPTSPSPSQTGAYPSGAPYAASDARSAGASSTPSQIHRHHHPTNDEDAAEDSDDDYAGDSDDLSNALSGVTLEAKAPVAYRPKPAPFAPTMPASKKAPARVAAPASSDPPPPGPSPLHAERLRRHSRADQGGTRGQEARAGAQEARRARPAGPRADRDDD